MIGEIARQLIGLFVDDGLLAVGILVAVAAIALLTLLGVLPTWGTGLLLVVSMPAALAASVVMSARRARRGIPANSSTRLRPSPPQRPRFDQRKRRIGGDADRTEQGDAGEDVG
jgi:hypothetical protein